jgi:hypothetical protein
MLFLNFASPMLAMEARAASFYAALQHWLHSYNVSLCLLQTLYGNHVLSKVVSSAVFRKVLFINFIISQNVCFFKIFFFQLSDETIIMILTFVMLFSSDFCMLQEYDKVVQIQV